MNHPSALTALAFAVLTFGFSHSSSAQGCSDAGVCTAGSLGHGPSEGAQWNVGLNYGVGEQGILYLDAELGVVLPWGEANRFDLRLPFRSIFGDLDHVSGLADVQATWIRNWSLGESSEFSSTVGIRIPTGDANGSTEAGMALPMPYQTTLGTVDLLLGASYRHNHWLMSAGYQQPLTSNRNGYLAENDSLSETPFPSTRNFERKGDVVARFGRQFGQDKDAWVFSASALGIYHLGLDRYESPEGEKIEIAGSDGITLNLTGSVRRNFTDNQALVLDLGFPLLVREVRPDGLTRGFVLGLRWRQGF